MRREVRSPIAGSVWSHVASAGQCVTAGSVLIVIECMKSEFPVEASADAVVAWLRPCGETIEAEDVVVVLEVG